MRLSRPVALIVALTCVGGAVGAEQEPVTVKDISVHPRANLKSSDDTFTLHPKVMVGVGYNDNIFATQTNEKDDFYGRGLVGLMGDWRLNPHNSIAFNGEFEGLHYSKSENKKGNMVGGVADVDFKWKEANNEGLLHGGYARFDDPLVETGQQILRENIVGAGSLTMQGSAIRSVTMASITGTNYLEAGLGFTELSRDNTVYDLTERVGVTTARDTFYYALVGINRSDYWQNTQFNDSVGITAGLGTQFRLGDRATMTAEGGVTYRMYENNFNNNVAYDDEKYLAPYADIKVRWPWESGSHVGINLFSRVDESLTANAAWVYGAALDGRLRLLARSGLFAGAAFYHSEDSGQGIGIATQERDTFEVSGGFDHELCRGCVGRLKATYTDSDTDVSNSFTRLIVAADIAIAY